MMTFVKTLHNLHISTVVPLAYANCIKYSTNRRLFWPLAMYDVKWITRSCEKRFLNSVILQKKSLSTYFSWYRKMLSDLNLENIYSSLQLSWKFNEIRQKQRCVKSFSFILFPSYCAIPPGRHFIQIHSHQNVYFPFLTKILNVQ